MYAKSDAVKQEDVFCKRGNLCANFVKFNKVIVAESLYADLPKGLNRQELLSLILEQSPALLEHVPAQDKTPALCLACVRKDPQLLGFVPKHLLSDPLLLETAVAADGTAIRFVPLDKLTRSLVQLSLSHKVPKNGYPYLPRAWQSREAQLKYEAMGGTKEEQRPTDFRPKFLRAETYLEKSSCIEDTQFVHPSEKTKAFWAEALKRNPQVLRVMPKEVLTPDFVSENFERLLDALEFGETYEIVYPKLPHELFLSVSGFFLTYLDPASPSYEAWKHLAVKTTGASLGLIPESSRSEALCLEALKNDPYAVLYVPRYFLSTPSFREKALSAVAPFGIANFAERFLG